MGGPKLRPSSVDRNLGLGRSLVRVSPDASVVLGTAAQWDNDRERLMVSTLHIPLPPRGAAESRMAVDGLDIRTKEEGHGVDSRWSGQRGGEYATASLAENDVGLPTGEAAVTSVSLRRLTVTGTGTACFFILLPTGRHNPHHG
ncbi:hypothetical protein OsJ_21471 [Oryza sativa Japonica Group]|uniref:Uncharacterized protein n=1 Tax=Oryza sativa subsp. japonica TaxID=39947 RepID=Q656J8_ORYSJ|nr:hypothetical protein OsJ_21471 [Oryza sativa Japonica Group]BAD45269.1 hypothetical protein [Oryza sativa Japonica Group]